MSTWPRCQLTLQSHCSQGAWMTPQTAGSLQPGDLSASLHSWVTVARWLGYQLALQGHCRQVAGVPACTVGSLCPQKGQLITAGSVDLPAVGTGCALCKSHGHGCSVVVLTRGSGEPGTVAPSEELCSVPQPSWSWVALGPILDLGTGAQVEPGARSSLCICPPLPGSAAEARGRPRVWD